MIDGSQKLIDKVEYSAERMTKLIKDVLEYSEVSEDKKRLNKVNLNNTLTQIKQDFELMIADKGVIITSDDLGTVKAATTQMYQLFFELDK